MVNGSTQSVLGTDFVPPPHFREKSKYLSSVFQVLSTPSLHFGFALNQLSNHSRNSGLRNVTGIRTSAVEISSLQLCLGRDHQVAQATLMPMRLIYCIHAIQAAASSGDMCSQSLALYTRSDISDFSSSPTDPFPIVSPRRAVSMARVRFYTSFRSSLAEGREKNFDFGFPPAAIIDVQIHKQMGFSRNATHCL